MSSIMLHVKLNSDVHDSELLRRHVEENAAEIELALNDEVPLTFSIKRVGKHQFATDIHARAYGRLLVVSASDVNLFQAITEARRHLTRQIRDLRHQRLDRMRGRHGMRAVSF